MPATTADGEPGDGDCDPDDNGSEEDCTLRAAIEESNANEPAEGLNTIGFGITVAAQPATPLPAVTQPTEISTTTELNCAGSPGIVVSIDGQGAVSTGLRLTAPGSIACGLTVQRFTGTGIVAEGDDTAVRRSKIGTNTEGTTALPNTYGVDVEGEGVVIDSTQISGSIGSGVRVLEGAVGTTITRSKIGTDSTGSVALPNAVGVRVEGGAETTIGLPGTTNTISGNTYGVVVAAGSSGTVVQGNAIGTNTAGNLAVPNTSYGVRVQGGGTTTIGGEVSELGQETAACDDVCNTISANGLAGVLIESGTATVSGNTIGLNRAGTEALFGQPAGVRLGGTAQGAEVGGLRRVSAT